MKTEKTTTTKETKKITFKEMKEFNNCYDALCRKNENIENTKFGYGVKRFYEKNIAPVFKEFNTLLGTIRIDNALVDEKTKALLTIDKGRGFEYDKEGLKSVIKAENKLDDEWDIKEFEVEPYICKDIPELTEEEKETFKGLII